MPETTLLQPGFVHLRVHSEYAIIDSMIRVKPLISKVKQLNMPAVAVTDHVNLYALIKFYTAAQANGIKPVCGCDILIFDEKTELVSTLVFLVQNNAGYLLLSQLLSRAYLEGQRLEGPCVHKSWLEEGTDGLIVLSAALAGDVGKALVNDDIELAKSRIKYWMSLFPNRFYLELQRTGRAEEDRHIELAVNLAAEFDCPVVATNDVRFLVAEEFEAHEARVCIIERRTLDDPRRAHLYSEQQYLRSEEEMRELFSDIPEALANSVEIAQRCNLNLVLDKACLPNYPVPEGMTMNEFFRQLSEGGLIERLAVVHDVNSADFPGILKPYTERLEFELGIINQMGFPGYFLIVMEFIYSGNTKNSACV